MTDQDPVRPESIAALLDIREACSHAQAVHERGSESAEAADVGTALRSLAAERASLVETLDRRIRAAGDLPREPNPDLETLREAASAVKSALLGEPRTVALEESIKAELALDAAAGEALSSMETSDDTSLAESVAEASRAARRTLESLKIGPR